MDSVLLLLGSFYKVFGLCNCARRHKLRPVVCLSCYNRRPKLMLVLSKYGKEVNTIPCEQSVRAKKSTRQRINTPKYER